MTNDGKEDTAVLVKCGTQEQIQMIGSDGQTLATVTPESVPGSPKMPEFRSISLSGDTLTANMDVFGADDTTTPTEQQTWTYTFTGSSFALSPNSVQAVEPATPTTESAESVAPFAVEPESGESTPPTTTTTTSGNSTGG